MGFFEAAQKAQAIRKSSRLAIQDRDANRLPLVFGSDTFFTSQTGAWCGFHIPSKPWGYLPEKDRQSYFFATTGILDRSFPSGKDNAGHLLVTNHVYSADQWQAGLMERYADTAGPNFESYIAASRAAVEQSEFFSRDTYLMTRLGERGDYEGFKGGVRQVIDMFANGFGLDDSQPSDTELSHWTQQADQTVETLQSSWLNAQPISRSRLEWIVRHLDTPALPTPDLAPADEQSWGIGKWQTTLASYTEEVDLGMSGKNRYRCVKFEAPTGAGVSYAAFLPMAHIPDHLHMSQQWMHHASSLNFPVDISTHFEIVESDRAEKELDKPIWAAEAQQEEDADAGYRSDDITMAQGEELRRVKMKVQSGRLPLAYWQAVFMVADTSKEALLKKVTRLIRHYRDIQFELVCPRNDQRELFYQSFPSSDIIVNDWIQRTDAGYLGAAQPWLTTSVGDSEAHPGLYQGYTIVTDSNGAAQKGVPVFYDLQNVVDEVGKAPTEVVCGNPGSGKTVSRGLKPALEDALRGVTQFIWDPKGDFLPLKAYASQMMLDPEKVRLIDLYKPNNSISLDAFAIAEVDPINGIDERASSAKEILESLCGHFLSDANMGTLYRRIISTAVRNELKLAPAEGRQPSMLGVLTRFRKWAASDLGDLDIQESRFDNWIDAAQSLLEHLEFVQTDTLGRLLFADPETNVAMDITPGTMTIFVAIKMKPTEEGERVTASSAISDVIAGLMTDYIRSLLFRLPDEVPKSLIFDEWHVIKRTGRALALIDWVKRMGRSKRCAVKQMSQNATDFDSGSLSTVWAGYAQSDTQAEASCGLLGIEPSEHNKRTLMNLVAGEFLFKDVYGRVARVKVDIWDQWLLDRFNTQAKDKARLAEELADSLAHDQSVAA